MDEDRSYGDRQAVRSKPMINREAVREYTTGSLWVLPGASAVAALLVGFAVSHLDVGPDSVLAPLAFQGTADDARG